MKKKILLCILFSLVILPAFAANWIEVVTKKGITVFLDKSSIRINNDNRLFYWIKFDENNGTSNKMFMVSDCNTNETGILSTIKTYPNGKIVKDEKDQSNFELKTIVPDSLSENIHNSACKIISDNTATWSSLMNKKDKALANNDMYYAELFLQQASDEANKLNQNSFGKRYLIKTDLAYIDFCNNLKRYNDAIQICKILQIFIQDDTKYNDLNYKLTQKIQEVQSNINTEKIIQDQQKKEEEQKKVNMQYQQQLQQQQSMQNSSNAINGAFNIMNMLRY